MRQWIKSAVLCWALFGLTNAVAAGSAPVRIGLTPVFLTDQSNLLRHWKKYLESRLERPVTFVQRASYRDITTLINTGKLDFAWICGYPYVRNKNTLSLLAVPVYRGKPTYQSYLIVPATDQQTHSIADLRGKSFAFSDPDSNSGYLVPVNELRLMGEQPNTFFGKPFFAWSHRKVVEAVAVGLAQGGATDSYIWDTLALLHPDLTAQTRIVRKSPDFGFPPFVSGKSVARSDTEAMRKTLLGMTDDEDGRKLLQMLNLDGFVPGNERMYDSIAEMMKSATD